MSPSVASPGSTRVRALVGAAGSPRALALACAALLPASYILEALLRGPAGEPAAGLLGGALRLGFAATAPGLLLDGVLDALPGRRDPEHALARMLRAMALSPVVLGLSCLCLCAGLGVSLDAATALAAPALAGLCVVVAGWPRAHEPHTRPSASAAVVAWPLLVLGALAAALLAPPGARVLGDAPAQAAEVARWLVGGLPVEDPGLAEAPPSAPWLHGFALAANVALSGLDTPLVAAFGSVAALLAYVGLGMRLATRGTPRWLVGCAALAVPFSLNLLAPLLLWTGTGLLESAPEAWGEPRHYLMAAAGPGNRRGVTLLVRMLEMGALAPCLARFALLLDAARPARPVRARDVGVASFALAVTSPWAAALGCLALICAPGGRAGWRGLAGALVGLAAALALVAPALLSGVGTPELGHSGVSRHHGLGVLWNAPPLLLALAVAPFGPWSLERRRLAGACLAALLLGTLLVLPDRHEARLLLLASLPAGLLLLDAGMRLGARLPRCAAALGLLALCLAGVGHALSAYATLGSHAVAHPRFAAEGAFLVRTRDDDRAAALHWLRAHAAADAVVLESPRRGGDEEVTAATGRASFLGRAGRLADGPRERREARRRRPWLEGLAGGVVPAAPLARRIRGVIGEREAYLLLESPPGRPVARAPEPGAALAREGFTPVFQQGRVRLERLPAGGSAGSSGRNESARSKMGRGRQSATTSSGPR